MPWTRPGTYATESTAPQVPAPGNQGGIAFFVGTAPMGSDQPGAVFWDLESYQTQYGDAATSPGYTGPLAAYLFFKQSGPGGNAKGMMFKRVGATHATLSLAGTGLDLTLTATAAYAGIAGNSISVVVAAESGGTQSITITDANGVVDHGGAYVVTVNSTTASNLMALINANSSMFTASAPTDANVPFTTGTFTPTGGTTGFGATIGSSDIASAAAYYPNYVVTLDGSMTTAGLLQTHVETLSNNSTRNRSGATGPSIGTSISTIGTNCTSLTTSDGRMNYCGHDGIKITSPATGLPMIVDGFYGAAIETGIRCSSDPGEPGTNKAAAGILGFNTALQPSDENTLTQGGAFVFTQGYGQPGASSYVLLLDQTTTLATANATWAYQVNRTAVDQVISDIAAWNAINAIGKRGGSKTASLIVSGWTEVLADEVNADLIDAYGTVKPVQSGNGFNVPLSLTINGEVIVINIPVAVQ